jgi:hypothetical protein
MGITSTYKPNVAYKELKANQEVEYLKFIKMAKVIATRFVEDARSQPEGHHLGFYDNRTFMLRNSIAAYIFRDGFLIWANERGHAAENRKIISEEVVLTYKGFDVIGMAGKFYASYVEKIHASYMESKGYNVVTNQGNVFILDLTKLMSTM